MRRFMSQVIFGVVLVVCAWSGWAGAAALRVDPNDPNAFPTIGEAVAAAANGDTIVMASGIYRGAGNRDVAPAGKSLALRGEGGAERCIIDCEGRGSAFVLDTGRPGLVLDGFTITGGRGPTGGAICASSAGMLTLLNCVFVGNQATESGGAVYQGTQLPFGFEARGDVITLRSAVQGIPTGLVRSHVLRGTLTDVTLVRRVNSVGSVELAPSIEPTLGRANATIAMSPVVITEIMYAPDGIATARYVEIANATAAPVALTDAGAGLSWMLGEYPSCRIPLATGMVLPPGGRLLFAEDPNTLVQVYPDIPPEVKIVGPWTGFLPYEAGTVSLYAPNVPDGRWVIVDSVTYNGGSPLLQDHWDRYWSLTASGQGDSLHRRSLTAYANDPSNWEAGPPHDGLLTATTTAAGMSKTIAWPPCAFPIPPQGNRPGASPAGFTGAASPSRTSSAAEWLQMPKRMV